MGAFVNLREALERHVDGEHLLDLGVAQERHVVSRLEPDGAVVAAALQARARPGVIHQNAPHRLRGNREEAVAVGGGELTLLQETEVDLVDQRRGRERVAGRLAPELPAGHLTQLVVDQRHEALQGVTIARAPAFKPLCDMAIGHSAVPTSQGVGGHHNVSDCRRRCPLFDPAGAISEVRMNYPCLRYPSPSFSDGMARFLERTSLATPFLVMDVAAVAGKYLELRRTFPDAAIYYAVKANPLAGDHRCACGPRLVFRRRQRGRD